MSISRWAWFVSSETHQTIRDVQGVASGVSHWEHVPPRIRMFQLSGLKQSEALVPTGLQLQGYEAGQVEQVQAVQIK